MPAMRLLAAYPELEGEPGPINEPMRRVDLQQVARALAVRPVLHQQLERRRGRGHGLLGPPLLPLLAPDRFESLAARYVLEAAQASHAKLVAHPGAVGVRGCWRRRDRRRRPLGWARPQPHHLNPVGAACSPVRVQLNGRRPVVPGEPQLQGIPGAWDHGVHLAQPAVRGQLVVLDGRLALSPCDAPLERLGEQVLHRCRSLHQHARWAAGDHVGLDRVPPASSQQMAAVAQPERLRDKRLRLRPRALEEWGRLELGRLLRHAVRVARRRQQVILVCHGVQLAQQRQRVTPVAEEGQPLLRGGARKRDGVGRRGFGRLDGQHLVKRVGGPRLTAKQRPLEA
mmetsp:Transcript_15382/g.48833  ORF Transcript_15382/g.48833 Transcript_15382/m.48833 type:complete len:341 (-) Transcript_15382:2706-3728(-)